MNTEMFDFIFRQAGELLPALDISGCLVDDTQRVLWAGPRTARYIHVMDSTRQQYLSEICPHTDDSDIQKMIARALATGELEKYSFPDMKPGEARTYHRYLLIPLKIHSDARMIILVVHLLLTADEGVQLERRNTERRLANLSESAADAIVSVDRDGFIQFWNKGAEQIFGYSSDEVIGKNPEFLIPQRLRDAHELQWLIEKTKEQGAIVNYETERLAKGGRTFIAEITRTALINEDGEFEGSSAIIKDISDRKEMENELTLAVEELSKLNELIDFLYSSRDLNEIYRLILVGVTAGEGLRYNRAFLIMVDEEQNALHGQMAVGPNSAEDASKIWDSIGVKHSLAESLESYKHGIGVSDEDVNAIVRGIHCSINEASDCLVRVFHSMNPEIVRRGSGCGQNESDILNLFQSDEIAVVPLLGKNLKIGVLVVDNKISRQPIRDEDLGILRLFSTQSGLAIENAMLYQKLSAQLDELKKAYADLQNTQSRLIEAERLATLGEFTAIMAHEIRNPLVSVGGFARLLEDDTLEKSDREKYVDIIIKESERLEKILTNLLDFSRSKKSMEKSSHDINDIVKRTLILFDEQIRHSSITLKTEFGRNLPRLMINDLEIIQVFLNLFQNAIQAIRDRGEIIIRSYVRDSSIIVEIRDNGEGIEESIRDRIFEPFFSTKPKGSGLGLVVTRQLISKYNGDIKIQSENGNGTLVQISFPVQD